MEDHKRREMDREVEELKKAFYAHREVEEAQWKQQQEIYDALFRLENTDKNESAGVVQLLVRTAESVEALRLAADRQKTFIGAAFAAIAAVWFFITQVVPLALGELKKHL